MTKISNEAIYRAAVAIYCAGFVTDSNNTPDYSEEYKRASIAEESAVATAKLLAALIEEGEG